MKTIFIFFLASINDIFVIRVTFRWQHCVDCQLIVIAMVGQVSEVRHNRVELRVKSYFNVIVIVGFQTCIVFVFGGVTYK